MIIGVILIAVVGILAAILLRNPLKLKQETVKVEFGQTISMEAKDYLSKDVEKNIVKHTKVSYKKNPVEGQSYDQIGKYTIHLTYKSKKKDVTVKVEDTTAPKFNATADAGIDTIEGVELNFAELITITDLSPAEISFDDSGVDLKTPGTYTLKAVAKDKAGNEAVKDITVNVAKKPVNMSETSVLVDSKTGKVTVQSKSSSYTSRTSGSKSSGTRNYTSNKSSGTSGAKSNGSSSGGLKKGDSGKIDGNHSWVYDGEEEWDGNW